MLTVSSADGTDVRAYDDGQGPAILIIGPGLDEGTRTKKLAAILARRFHVIRLHRRQYRLDLKTNGAPYSVAQEVDDVLAVADRVGRPLIIYGHSSGAMVALEALVASPSTFAGAVIFEPAMVTVMPWARERGEVIKQMRAAIAAGKPGKAMAIFACDATGLPVWQARMIGVVTSAIPRYRRLVSCQADDLQAMVALGTRLDAYAQIGVPTVLLGGDRSPARIAAPLDALERVMPNAERVVMHKRDHGADVKAPKEVGGIIETFADKVLTPSRE